ncbi:hypothetical protein HDU84_003049 [Entophlyctis sp. JEL0112]|nr:hypothetical protein HDU84_003049 [Entophlyctis sp. JEL0112]
MRLNFKVVNPRAVTYYGMAGADAQELIDSGYIAALCNASDVIIIADTVPDGRGILLAKRQRLPDCANTSVIVEMTNRYDWNVPDREEYHKMLRALVAEPPKDLVWTQNNPFEAPFIFSQVGSVPNVSLVRSMGVWAVDKVVMGRREEIFNEQSEEKLDENGENDDNDDNEPAIQDSAKANATILTVYTAYLKNFIGNSEKNKIRRPIVDDLIEYFCMPIEMLPKKYGGPIALLEYKAFVLFPYQVSIMKFYENIAHGVPQVIPTPGFLRLLGTTNNHHYFSTWLEKLEVVQKAMTDPVSFWKAVEEEKRKEEAQSKNQRKNSGSKGSAKKGAKPPKRKTQKEWQQNQKSVTSRKTSAPPQPYEANWTEWCDFYRKEFEPFVYFFDSWLELAALINKPPEEFDFKNLK